MLAVHVGPTDVPGLLGRLYAAPYGRASLLFVLVAGVGVSLLASSRRADAGKVRWILGWRALLLLPAGLALQELDHGANVILQDYAVLFVLAIVLLPLPGRWLLALAAGAAALGPVAYLLGQARAPEVYTRAPTTLTDPVVDTVHGLVLSGPYPLLTLAAPFLFGMWLGRQDLGATLLQRRLAIAGWATAITAFLAARGLVALLGPPTTSDDPRFLVTSAAHGQMPLWLIGGTGAAVGVLGVALLVAARFPRATWPLASTGQLALTVYVGHLVLLHTASGIATSDRLLPAVLITLTLSALAVAVAAAWRSVADRGPLEVLLRPPPMRLPASSGAT